MQRRLVGLCINPTSYMPPNVASRDHFLPPTNAKTYLCATRVSVVANRRVWAENVSVGGKCGCGRKM
jgi:hypothetical protein